ncbi:ABC transporter permease [Paenibacillus sp. UMB4589-SE434]|uniref:ABC transporter permease n=1 Tax=Paenibacillus sp. UMB4589-SE434 TaxID=3046314 RepID=UPI002550F028|nr:ABC transporter permease [Paenibacillus sp. UMB4589-SE434]MDK8179291.1 ABC transporter permease [Paenibacillus sp. UMB4589-SE434]
MTFRRLAFSNIRQSWHRYAAYFLSCVFSVTVFFLYSSFIYHPDIVSGKVSGGEMISGLIVVCQFMIMMFSFFFVLYSSSAFLRSRKKEFGLFTLFGMTKWQMRRMVIYENMIISLLAIASGMAAGAVTLKLFLMVLSHLLRIDTPLPFYISLSSIQITIIAYLLLFALITLFSLRKVGKLQIIQLIKAENQTRKPPRFSWLLFIASLVLIGSGYYMAFNTDLLNIVANFFPTIGLTFVGTYFLYTQGSTAIVKLLSYNKRYLYTGTNLLNVTQATYRIRDNARVLYTITLLSAVVLTASATFFVVDKGLQIKADAFNPFQFTVMQIHGEGSPLAMNKVKDTVESHGHQITAAITANILLAYVEDVYSFNKSAAVIGVTKYNEIAISKQFPKVKPITSGVYWIDQSEYIKYTDSSYRKSAALDKVTIKVEGMSQSYTAKVIERREQVVMTPSYTANLLFVVPDNVMLKLQSTAPAEEKRIIYNIDWTDGNEALPLVQDLKKQLAADSQHFVSNRIEDRNELSQTTSLIFFIGIFISLLFFIASGSIIYFKLFSDLQEDQAYFRSLTRIGLSLSEIRRVVNVQVGLVFFLPCVVGSVHTMFAMKTLSNLLLENIMGYASTIVCAFIVMQFIYFLAARRTYLKKIMQEIVI